jgi:hypothetical protein
MGVGIYPSQLQSYTTKGFLYASYLPNYQFTQLPNALTGRPQPECYKALHIGRDE